MDCAKTFTFKSDCSGSEIMTYRWDPAGNEAPRAVLYLVHGIHSWTGFEFLEMGSNGFRDSYEGSIVERYNQLGVVVCANDHTGHGKSSGVRGFFNMKDLLGDIKQNMAEQTKRDPQIQDLPAYIQGSSMGGLMSTLMLQDYPDLFKGAILVSPAVVPPPDMIGFAGKILAATSSLLTVLVPQWRTIKLPPSLFPDLQKQFEDDPYTYKDGLRVRSGREMLVSYQLVNEPERVARMQTPVVVFTGTEDTLVDPQQQREYFEKVPTEDRKHTVLEGMWHDLLHEKDSPKVREIIFEWIEPRLSKA